MTEDSGYSMIRKIQIQMAEHEHQSSLMDRQKIGVSVLWVCENERGGARITNNL